MDVGPKQKRAPISGKLWEIMGDIWFLIVKFMKIRDIITLIYYISNRIDTNMSEIRDRYLKSIAYKNQCWNRRVKLEIS